MTASQFPTPPGTRACERMRCLLILAHPRRASLCGALFDACTDGARQAGVECRQLILSQLFLLS